jgi:hypothetical protein
VAGRVLSEYLHDAFAKPRKEVSARLTKHSRFECRYGANNTGEDPNPVLSRRDLAGLESVLPPTLAAQLKEITYFG